MYSPSQLKTFNKSKAERAGKYILGIKDPDISPEPLIVGAMIETKLLTGIDDRGIADKYKDFDKEKVVEWYDNTLSNMVDIPKVSGQYQVKAEGKICGEDFMWYIDVLDGETIIDIKTSHYLTKQDTKTINMRSGLTSMEEYEFQLRCYMTMTGKKTAFILEIAKHPYKEKWQGKSRQIIVINMTDELDKKRTERTKVRLEEMKELRARFGK